MKATNEGSLIRFHLVGHTAVLTLDNGPVNVMSIPMAHELDALVDRCASDSQIRAVVLTGAGTRAFCAGSDIREFPELQKPGAAVEKKLRRQNAVFTTLSELSKPTIAALQGLAFGGGLELALCCDLILAEEHVTMALPETNLGVFPSSGGTYRTVRRTSSARAKELIFLAEPISAHTAESWGLINRVVPQGTALNEALELGERLATRPPQALALAKALINEAAAHSDREMVERSLAASDVAFSSAECVEGTRAFHDHRPPQFHADPPAHIGLPSHRTAAPAAGPEKEDTP